MTIHQLLGGGHRERIYADAMEVLSLSEGAEIERELRIQLGWKGRPLGHPLRLDFVLNGVPVEFKSVPSLTRLEFQQMQTYMVAFGRPGLLINFGGPSLEFKRVFPVSSDLSGTLLGLESVLRPVGGDVEP